MNPEIKFNSKFMDLYPLYIKWVKIYAASMDKGFLAQQKSQQPMPAFKTASKRAIQKAPEATDDLFLNKIAEKITKITSVLSIGTLKERYISHCTKKEVFL